MNVLLGVLISGGTLVDYYTVSEEWDADGSGVRLARRVGVSGRDHAAQATSGRRLCRRVASLKG